MTCVVMSGLITKYIIVSLQICMNTDVRGTQKCLLLNLHCEICSNSKLISGTNICVAIPFVTSFGREWKCFFLNPKVQISLVGLNGFRRMDSRDTFSKECKE